MLLPNRVLHNLLRIFSRQYLIEPDKVNLFRCGPSQKILRAQYLHVKVFFLLFRIVFNRTVHKIDHTLYFIHFIESLVFTIRVL